MRTRKVRVPLRASGLFTLALLGLAFAASAAARPPGKDTALTAEALTALAMSENPGIQSMRAAAQAARFRVAPAGALDDPTLRYSVPPRSFGDRLGNVELSQTLPWPGKLSLREEAARERASAAAQDTEDARLQVAAAARSLYAEWAYVHRALAINAAHRKLLQELRSVAETRYAAGQAGQQDALQAEVARARLEAEAIALERQRREVRARINALLNRPPEDAVPAPAGLPEPKKPLPSLESLSELAVQRHPELDRARAGIAAASAEAKLAEKDFYPDFRVSTGYNSLWDNEAKRWTVGVSINLPFDFGNKRSGALDAARAELARQRFRLNERQSRLLGELAAARAAAAETADVIALYRRRLLPLADDNLSAARADYRAGSGSFLAVIDAEREKLRTEDRLARAQADYQRRRAELARWIGTPVPNAPRPQAAEEKLR